MLIPLALPTNFYHLSLCVDVWRSDEGEEDPHTLAGGGGLAGKDLY